MGSNGDLISRSALWEQYKTEYQHAGALGNAHIKKEWQGALQLLYDAPAVDAVVLPVKPGDTVWILNHRFPAEIEEICIREDGVFAVWV